MHSPTKTVALLIAMSLASCGGETPSEPNGRQETAATVAVTPAGASVTGVGGTQTFAVEARDGDGNLIMSPSVTWSSYNPDVASIDANGIATVHRDGQVTLGETVDTITGYAVLTASIADAPPVAFWTVQSSGSAANLHGVWGTSPADVYAVGTVGTWANESGIVLHFDGSQWREHHIQPFGMLVAIWGTSSDNVYAGGKGLWLHYDGNGWSRILSGPGDPSAIWGTSPSDMYAVSDEITLGIYHYDGSAWTEQDYRGASSIWGTSANDAYAGTWVIYHYDGSRWSEQLTGVNEPIQGIWGTSSSDIYAVATNGTILRGSR